MFKHILITIIIIISITLQNIYLNETKIVSKYKFECNSSNAINAKEKFLSNCISSNRRVGYCQELLEYNFCEKITYNAVIERIWFVIPFYIEIGEKNEIHESRKECR